MTTAAAYDKQIRQRFVELGQSDQVIADALGITKGAVVGRRHRLGIYRDGPHAHRTRPAPARAAIGQAEAMERKIDMRDLSILSDMDDGHTARDCSRFYSVDQTYIEDLHEEASQQ